jgi:hypothetical protein
MGHEEPDMMSDAGNAAQKLSCEKAIKFAKRRAAAKKAAETRRNIADRAKEESKAVILSIRHAS